MKKQRKVAIRRIKVEKLLGLYDYEIPRKDDKKNIDTILILYGENGSGKTTILKLIFHLLGYELRKGHKTYVAKTKFRRIEIEFTNGYKVLAIRKAPSLIGSFAMQLRRNGKTLGETEYQTDSSNDIVTGSQEEEEKQDEFIRSLGVLNLSLYHLSDDRMVKITLPPGLGKSPYERLIDEEFLDSDVSESPIGRRTHELDPEQILRWLLERSIERATAWIRQQVMSGSKQGESDVNLVFSDIIERITGAPAEGKPQKKITREDLLERISRIEKRNRNFSKFGVTPRFDAGKLVGPLQKASGRQFLTVRPILIPYLDSFEAKLNALSEAQDRIETLIDAFNSFLVDKQVSFHIGEGFKVKSRNNEELSPGMLSSGERHLFLLFCNTITALDKQSIFIIDEPEISLNVKWQRTLISSLLDCARGGAIQYVFATHSMELLTQHLDKVVKLESKGE